MHQDMDYLVIEYQNYFSYWVGIKGVWAVPPNRAKVRGRQKLLVVQYCGIFKYYSQMN
jgi:hypothetical protein